MVLMDGEKLESIVGPLDEGMRVGAVVGGIVEENDGTFDGLAESNRVGPNEGDELGALVENEVDENDGVLVGESIGTNDGTVDNSQVGEMLGKIGEKLFEGRKLVGVSVD